MGVSRERLRLRDDELCKLSKDLVPEEGIEPSRGVTPTGF